MYSIQKKKEVVEYGCNQVLEHKKKQEYCLQNLTLTFCVTIY